MSALTSCPKCSGRVALPTGAHENGWVRCPICGAEYPLRYVQEYRPPELVLIEEPAVPFEGRAPTWGAVAAAAPAPEGAAAGSEIVAPLAGPAVVETLAPPVGAVGLVSSTDINDESDVITFDESLLPDEPTEVLPDTDDTLEPYEISDNLTQGAQSRDVRLADEEETVTVFEPAETSGRVRPSEFGLPPRRRSRRGNPIVMIAGIVGGGVVGLAIGYSILMWVFAKDPFALASKLPAVLVPAALRSAGSQAEPGDAANGPSTQPTASPDDLALDRIAADRSESSPEPSLEPLVDDAKVDSAAVAAADSTTPVDDKAADPFGGPAVTAPPAVSSSNWRVTMPVAGATPGTGEEPVGPTAARQFSLTDLMAAVRAARTTTRAALTLPATADQATKNAVSRTYYTNLTKIAEALTHLDRLAEQPARDKAADAAVASFLDAAPTAERLDELGKLSGYWFAKPQADGIVLAGMVKDSQQQGKLFQSAVQTLGKPMKGDPPVITVLSSAPLTDDPSRPVLIAGTIVNDPAATVRGYAGSADRVVWAALALEPTARQ